MESPAHALLSLWETYYVILGGSAAALTGLQFVVIAIASDTETLGSEQTLNAFGTPTVVHFSACLLLAGLVAAPWHTFIPLSWLLLASGVSGTIYSAIVVRRAWRQTHYRPVLEDWIWHVVLPLVAYLVLIWAGAILPIHPVTALFLVGGVALALIFVGIHNAWDAVAYMVLRHRSGPRSSGPPPEIGGKP